MSYVRRYNVIDLQPNVAVGIKIPFTGKNGVLFDLSYSTEDQALSNLKSLILTRKGERLYQPYFGTDLQNQLFEPNNDTIESKIEDTIKEAIAFWLPYIKIKKLIVNSVIAVRSTTEENGVKIELEVSVDTDTANKSITFLVTPSAVEIL